MSPAETPLQIFGEIVVSMVLGGAIGLEREIARRPAGLRTHMLVAGMATLLVALGNTVVLRFSVGMDPAFLRADPLVIVQAIITGMSFLCAGTVFRLEKEQRVEGLTTGASLLFTSALGICVAVREFFLAIAVTILVLVILWVVGRIERHLGRASPLGTTDESPPRREGTAGP